MRRNHHSPHEHDDPLVRDLRASYGGRVPDGLIEARVAALDAGPDALSCEHLARAEVASLAARAAARPRGRR